MDILNKWSEGVTVIFFGNIIDHLPNQSSRNLRGSSEIRIFCFNSVNTGKFKFYTEDVSRDAAVSN